MTDKLQNTEDKNQKGSFHPKDNGEKGSFCPGRKRQFKTQVVLIPRHYRKVPKEEKLLSNHAI